jgi:hypothetical protein
MMGFDSQRRPSDQVPRSTSRRDWLPELLGYRCIGQEFAKEVPARLSAEEDALIAQGENVFADTRSERLLLRLAVKMVGNDAVSVREGQDRPGTQRTPLCPQDRRGQLQVCVHGGARSSPKCGSQTAQKYESLIEECR